MNKKVASSCTWWFCKTCSIQCPLMIFYFWYQVYQISHKCILINHFKHHIKPRWCENTHIESYSYKTYLYNQSLKNKNQFALFHYFDFWNCISCVSEIYIRGVISIGCFLIFFHWFVTWQVGQTSNTSLILLSFMVCGSRRQL